jgi:hypothetical protein
MEERGYRLGPVRVARERAEAVRRNDLTDRLGEARTTEADLASARDRTRSAREALANASAATTRIPTPAARLAATDRYIARRRRELADARDAELRAELAHGQHLDGVELARRQLGRARAEREVIERHFARWRDTQRKLRERRDD